MLSNLIVDRPSLPDNYEIPMILPVIQLGLVNTVLCACEKSMCKSSDVMTQLRCYAATTKQPI